MIKKIFLYYNTIKHLKLTQIVHQIKQKFIKDIPLININYKSEKCEPIKIEIDELDIDNFYINRFKVEDILNNRILLLNEEHEINLSNWKISNASHLWNFNLHYFEYGIALAATYKKKQDLRYYKKFKELLCSWIKSNADKKSDAWQAYTISLRIPNLFICFELFGDVFWNDIKFKEYVIQNIYLQYKYLFKHQELHLLGNHYFENLKTILICSKYFGEESIYNIYFPKLLNEIKEQILEDGLHFELSLMYHKIILEDIIRIAVCLRHSQQEDMKKLLSTIQNMVDALASLEKGMGKTPLFNDAGDGVAKETHQLLNSVKQLFNIDPKYKTNFPAAGYHKYYKGNISIMFDTGKIGPEYMPGHGHCDTLSFELSIADIPVFVNSGTYQYQGELRKYFRSTEAHNTVKIGEHQQSECWGEHRVARRIHKVTFQETENGLTGSYKNYIGNIHQREMYFNDIRKFVIKDQIKVKKTCTIHSFLHFAPRLSVKEVKDGNYIVFDKENQLICTIAADASRTEKVVIHNNGLLTNYAPFFGVLEKKTVLEFQWKSEQKYIEIIINFNNDIS